MQRGGKIVPDDASCVSRCCGGNCQRVYVYAACVPDIPGYGFCDTLPPDIAVCSDAVCDGQPISNFTRIFLNGRCWQRNGTAQDTIRTSSWTGQIYDSADLDCTPPILSCSDPRCLQAFNVRWIKGVPCPGQPDLPDVYFLACLVQTCDVLGPGSLNASDLQGCYQIFPGNGTADADVPADAKKYIVVVDGHYGGKCCRCVPTCSEQTKTVQQCGGQGGSGAGYTVQLKCCCSQARTVTGSINSTTTYHPGVGGGTRSIVGSGTWVYNDIGQLISQTGGMATVTEVFPWGTNTYDVPISPWAGCADEFSLPSAFPLGPPFGYVEQCEAFPIDAGDNRVEGLTNTYITCKNAHRDGTWRLVRQWAGDPNIPPGTTVINAVGVSDWSVTYSGRCGGECGGATATSKSELLARRKVTFSGCAGCGSDGETGGATI